MSESILVVDDDLAIQVLLRSHLEAQGYSCSVASDGLEALGMLNQGQIRLLITDLDMPGMSGLELMRQVRQRAIITRCMVVTGYATLGNLTACLQEGAVALVPKPLLDFALLDQAVALAFEQIRLWNVQMRAILRLKPEGSESAFFELHQPHQPQAPLTSALEVRRDDDVR